VDIVVSVDNPNDQALDQFQIEVDVSTVRTKIGDKFRVLDDGGNPVPYCFAQPKGECNATPSDAIWVKVPHVDANGTATFTIVQTTDPGTSPGDQVFVFYDDFTEDSLDTDKWVCGTQIHGCISHAIENGLLKTRSGGHWGILTTHPGLVKATDQVVVDARAKSHTADTWFLIELTSTNTETNRFCILDDYYSEYFIGIQVTYRGGASNPHQFSQPMNNDTWYHLRIIKKSEKTFRAEFMDDGFSVIDSYETTHNEWASVDGWRIVQWKAGSNPDYWDYVLVRKWVPTDPVVTVK